VQRTWLAELALMLVLVLLQFTAWCGWHELVIAQNTEHCGMMCRVFAVTATQPSVLLASRLERRAWLDCIKWFSVG
jgi:hypothetical protein